MRYPVARFPMAQLSFRLIATFGVVVRHSKGHPETAGFAAGGPLCCRQWSRFAQAFYE